MLTVTHTRITQRHFELSERNHLRIIRDMEVVERRYLELRECRMRSSVAGWVMYEQMAKRLR
jgi:hypothetical protein